MLIGKGYSCFKDVLYRFLVPLEIHWIVLPPKVVEVKYTANLFDGGRYLSYIEGTI